MKYKKEYKNKGFLTDLHGHHPIPDTRRDAASENCHQPAKNHPIPGKNNYQTCYGLDKKRRQQSINHREGDLQTNIMYSHREYILNSLLSRY